MDLLDWQMNLCLEKIKAIYIKYLEEIVKIPNEITETIFYFDSDENVQKNIMATIFMRQGKIFHNYIVNNIVMEV